MARRISGQTPGVTNERKPAPDGSLSSRSGDDPRAWALDSSVARALCACALRVGRAPPAPRGRKGHAPKDARVFVTAEGFRSIQRTFRGCCGST